MSSKDNIIIYSPEEIEAMRHVCRLASELLDYITPFVKAGVSTLYLDDLMLEYTEKTLGAKSACLNYAPAGMTPYPRATCISVNNVICHGIPSENEILIDGDIINVDVSTILNGYFSDASRMFTIGEVSPEAERIVRVTKECVELGLKAAKPWGHLGDIAYAINSHAQENGYSVVEEIGGHGIGLEFNEEPWIGYHTKPGTEMLIVPGMTFTIEPMVNVGTYEVSVLEDDWTTVTDDGELSAHFEHSIAVTDDGPIILTAL